ncbi:MULTISPECIES: hypothetical protein [Psychrobacter]|uniref:hypothetical protein n=1 Tax=Psychrobacter TaxID=497 RepID=UPI00146ABDF2|nr:MULTISPECIES: hypothetical protein [Psychrobacter]
MKNYQFSMTTLALSCSLPLTGCQQHLAGKSPSATQTPSPIMTDKQANNKNYVATDGSGSTKDGINQMAENPAQKTSIFYYYVNPIRPAQSVALVQGKFEWKDGCIYLVGKDGVYNTATFPLYPKEIVNWEESSKTLFLAGRTYKMGDFISTNGQYSDYVPNSPIGREYEQQGNVNCLKSKLVQIGTE